MRQNTESHELMKELVDELIKDKPDTLKVQNLSRDLQLPYSADPVVQISTVLQSMSQFTQKKNSDIDFEVI